MIKFFYCLAAVFIIDGFILITLGVIEGLKDAPFWCLISLWIGILCYGIGEFMLQSKIDKTNEQGDTIL